MTPAKLYELSKVCKIKEYKMGNTVYTQNDKVDGAYMIIEGEVEIIKSSKIKQDLNMNKKTKYID